MSRLARQIVKGILRDLTDRRGLRHEWEGIDREIQAEIIRRWIAIADSKLGDPQQEGSK